MKKTDTEMVKTEVVKKQTQNETVSKRYVSPDGLIFYSKEEYRDYMDGLK